MRWNERNDMTREMKNERDGEREIAKYQGKRNGKVKEECKARKERANNERAKS